MELKFYKYQGAGNDFVLLDGRAGMPFELTSELVAGLCCRRKGIGADGLMVIENSEKFDFKMRYFNADGGESSMCGNGGRCIARLADDLNIGGIVKCFEAVDGTHRATINNDGTISLQMIDIEGAERIGDDFFINSGSPHYIIFGHYDIATARQKRNEHNCNVNFVTVLGDGHLTLRTFERGVENETWACGTGAVASAAALHFALQESCNSFVVDVIGGTLFVQFEGGEGRLTDVILTADAVKVFDGCVNI